ncbi:MAG: phosphate ABC transporter permease subunit PstC [Theionarchaea archaeon]|nr:phosphate ABC transporter permease subunit PstC [Theionarchaea archaeon]MBU7001313.1 phosphate ABC transporter permease subunit PstC [Theionarchaea archaeon]MBU7019804.1 phosphate ABC transporter permease subunit PstC [Theionarchaea archaeon]
MSMRKVIDWVSQRVMYAVTAAVSFLVVLIAAGLYLKARPILEINPIDELLTSSSWHPLKGEFGFYPFLMGTFWVTFLAMVFAIPICLLSSIYVSEYAPRRMRDVIKPLVDLLAGIPSVVYGVFGILAVVPFIRDVAHRINISTTGYSVLAGGIVLAIMVFPIIISVSVEVIQSVPYEARESSLSLGATQWQTVKKVVLKKAFPGIVAAIILGFSRAFGETMAVLMVVGNIPQVPHSIFDEAYPLTALIANNYGEMLSIPLYDSALLLGALILLLIVLLFSMAARLILMRGSGQ